MTPADADRAPLSNRLVPWYRDRSFYLAVLACALLKTVWVVLYTQVFRDTRWYWHMKYDVSTWRDFFASLRAGGIPYVDFPREYPVGAGAFFWLISPLFSAVSERHEIRVHCIVMSAIDVFNAALFYPLARAVSARRALWGTILFSSTLTGLVLSPMRFESVLVTTLLIGYGLHRRGHNVPAAALFSLGATLKWFPAFLFAAQEWKTFLGGRRDRWWRSILAFIGVQVLANAPFVIASWLAHRNIKAWTQTYLYHVDRPLSVDTIAGVLQLWFGYHPWERWLAPAALLLLTAALLARPRLPLTRKAVLLAIAMLLCNRIYSPQFNLWFYPFFVLHLLSVPSRRLAYLLGLFVVLDITNVCAYPFAFSAAMDEMGSLGAYAARGRGGFWASFWTACILTRAFVLIALAHDMLKPLARVTRPVLAAFQPSRVVLEGAHGKPL